MDNDSQGNARGRGCHRRDRRFRAGADGGRHQPGAAHCQLHAGVSRTAAWPVRQAGPRRRHFDRRRDRDRRTDRAVEAGAVRIVRLSAVGQCDARRWTDEVHRQYRRRHGASGARPAGNEDRLARRLQKQDDRDVALSVEHQHDSEIRLEQDRQDRPYSGQREFSGIAARRAGAGRERRARRLSRSSSNGMRASASRSSASKSSMPSRTRSARMLRPPSSPRRNISTRMRTLHNACSTRSRNR